MFPRRRLTGTVHSSEAVTTGAIRLGHLDSSRSSFGGGQIVGTIGASYISSSSSSSSSRSSSPVINPVRRSLRVETRRRTTAALQVSIYHHSLGHTLSRRRPEVMDSTTRRGTRSWDDPSLASSSAQIRSAVSVNSKPMNRTRRRALLRSPIVRLILSSSNTSPPCQPDNSSQSSTSAVGQPPRERSSHRGLDDSIRILHIESGDTTRPVRPRTTRSGTRATRTNPLARRRSQPTRTAAVPPNPTLEEAGSQLESQVAVDSEEFRAILNATRTNTGDGDDECVICLDPKANRSIVLPCMHTFCFECIYRWLCINPSCPLCKRLAHRIIHSILSDSDFTETLVSELQSQRNANGTHRLTGLPPGFELEEEGNSTGGQQSHHHFHYHLEAAPVRFLDYLGGMTHHRTSTGPPLFIPPILIPSDSPLSRTSPIETVLSGSGNGSRHIPYRWSTEYESSAETHRSLLVDLVNNALRPRFSSLLDGLLLRQLVYVFGFDSLPVSEDPQLDRDISPRFLADNEAQRHRLEAFVRRELRVLAPWLAYQPNDSSSASALRDQPGEAVHGHAIPAVTSPLLCGAPGLLAETVELDSIASRVLQHFTNVSMTDDTALVELLSSFPSLRPPLVPVSYLSHFASEVVQFARYTGTLEQYDSAVCLYRRRVSAALTSRLQDRSRSRRPDPRLAVYVASACWPRLRPGFAQPQGLITHPLNTWLLQRLFVHTVTGSTHPAQLSGTGEPPPTLPERIVFQPLSTPNCHPNCVRLSNISRALLGALPSLARMRSQATVRPADSSASERYDNSQSPLGLNVSRRMTGAELYPNRLLYQRVLSELIDQARFSEALSEYFHQFLSAREQRNNTAPVDLTEPNGLETAEGHSNIVGNRPGSSRRTETVSGMLQPALKVHPLALRRLNGLLLLFTARIPGLGNGVASDDGDDEDWMSELLHMPLLQMTVPSTIVDLTSTRGRLSRARRRPTEMSTRQSNFSGADWTFLRQLPWDSISSTSERREVPRPTVAAVDETSSVANSNVESVLSCLHNQVSSNLPSAESHPETDQSEPPRSSRYSSPTLESGWRNPAPSCVVISSDSSSSSSDEENRVVHVNTVYPLTTDESGSETESNCTEVERRISHRQPLKRIQKGSNGVTCLQEPSLLENADVREIETDAGNLSLNQEPATSVNATEPVSPVVDNLGTPQEEPMEVDERPEEIDVIATPVASGSKRPAISNTPSSSSDAVSDPNNLLCPSKLARLEAYFSGLPREWQHILWLRANESFQSPSNTSRPSLPKRMRHSGTGSIRTRVSRSRSPVCVGDTDDSDCELLHEYISLDSDSYSSVYSSSSASSTCESVSPVPSLTDRTRHARSRSRIKRSSKHGSSRPRRRESCRHCRKRRVRHHYRRSGHREQHSHSCCCISKLRRHRHHPATSRRYHRDRRIHRPRRPPLNTPNSPILISDDNEEQQHNDSLLVSSTHTEDACAQQQLHPTLEGLVTLKTSDEALDGDSGVSHRTQRQLSSSMESTSTSRAVGKQVQDMSTSTNDLHSPPPSCTSSTIPALPIFEPPTIDDFYRFLERFDAHTNEDQPVEQSQSHAYPNEVVSSNPNVESECSENGAIPSSPHVFLSTSPRINASDAPVASPLTSSSSTV
ncbi:hypothetical protein CSKR_204049 [Clonorchis sinensis]|uniref:RING-type E3 ubiquitin transferase n=1 Tax=Clonorchis sinensis TaxID=79923 RepID=A0A8T1M0W0_CLOSI|nr:hypothetical protein CSKR_204049 [Clonorchis sinensis]